jgi:hypothetical protein
MNLMRQIDNPVKPKWDEVKNGRKLEGFHEDCPPSLLMGWTDDNPSLWEIDPVKKPDITMILVALCRPIKKDWDRITYLLFDKSVIDNAKLSIIQTNGKTGDNIIDISKRHYEIENLTAKSLCTLVYYIMMSKFEIKHFKKTEYDSIIFTAYDSSRVIIQQKTDTMSIQPKSIEAITDTVGKDILNKEENIDKIYKPISSGSIDPSSGQSPSKTSE